MDLLFHSVGQIVIHIVRCIEGSQHVLFSVFVNLLAFFSFVLVVSLLDQNFGSKFFQELVCLTQKFLDFVVLCFFDQLKILCHILFLESLQSGPCCLIFQVFF